MSAQPTHDLVIKTGDYTDRMTGEMKARWLTIGTVFKHDDGGTSIKLDCVPVGLPDWQGWVNVYPRRQQSNDFQAPPGYQPRRNGNGNGRSHGRHNGNGSAPPPAHDFDNDIPF
ncbi:hypothetical protein [Thiocystis violacea]|uniref:hypothetical protein n=1 Tax=Thiocystis violacea TaxID=13725 RepID=UPI0019088D2D|nr:hypothetical protein [Thiocystis violacea]MBK1722806.1 hypothetical protein [Thiocystis violacea]